MQIPLFQIDAFAERVFEGNPAAVMPLTQWPDDELLQRLAAENNLSETAFYTAGVPDGVTPPTEDPGFHLRWFTPAIEVTLCGHATLATAAQIFEDVLPGAQRLWFHTLSGWLSVVRAGERRLTLDFPVVPAEPVPVDREIAGMLGADVLEMHQSLDLVCVLDDPRVVEELNPDQTRLRALDQRGVVVTAAGAPVGHPGIDFVCRYFGAGAGIGEDPVTGSAYPQIAPYWARRLGRDTLRARQLSARGGTVGCVVASDRVALTGGYRRYLDGVVTLPD